MPTTSTDELQKADESLPISPNRWSRVDHLSRLFYLQSCRDNLKCVAKFWLEEEAELRGHSPTSSAGAETWILGPVPVARMLRHLEHGLQSGGRPMTPSVRLRIDGRSVCRVFPFGFHEGLLYWGLQGHVWSVGTDFQGQDYRHARDEQRGPALVLGASNVSSIAATDVLSKLFCENRAVVCLIPERFRALLPIFNEIFYPLVRDRHLHFQVGGAKEGQELLRNPVFETVHLTGSLETFRKIRKENTFPQRTFTAEIGCVTPMILVPGSWTAEEVAYHARHLVSILLINGGYNCVTPQVLLLGKNWAQKNDFLAAVRGELAKAATRDDKFPNAAEKRRSWRADYPSGEKFGARTLVHVSPQAEERIFTEEAFCGMLACVEFEPNGAEAFLEETVTFCNERLWGDLSCNLIVDTVTRREHETAVAHAVTGLHYGTVCVNLFSGVGFVSGVTPWGSYRGGQADTGVGWVHNTFFFDRPEKSVLEGPFVPPIPPPWIKPFPHLSKVGKALFRLELEPSHRHLLQLAAAYGVSLWNRKGHRHATSRKRQGHGKP